MNHFTIKLCVSCVSVLWFTPAKTSIFVTTGCVIFMVVCWNKMILYQRDET